MKISQKNLKAAMAKMCTYHVLLLYTHG
jgi:hypothetical protein